jgi:cytidine deaminase
MVLEIEEATLDRLISVAKQAAERAYCPYSNFRVGAALLSEKGAVYSACNVENASYGLSLCAERNAVFHMVASGEKRFKILVMYTPTQETKVPCGACRQVMHEFQADAWILSVCDGPDKFEVRLSELLPVAFARENIFGKPMESGTPGSRPDA